MEAATITRTETKLALIFERYITVLVSRGRKPASVYTDALPNVARYVVLATLQGLIVGAFVATDWLSATSENVPLSEDSQGRWGFIGEEAPDELRAAVRPQARPGRVPKARRGEPDQVHVVR